MFDSLKKHGFPKNCDEDTHSGLETSTGLNHGSSLENESFSFFFLRWRFGSIEGDACEIR